jgi:hypothetical protein
VRAVLTILASFLPLLALSLFLLGPALILQPAQALANWCSFDASLFF